MRKPCTFLVSGILLLAPSFVFAATLITDTEAKLPAAEKTITTRAITRGPGIRVISPDTSSPKIASPFPLRIAFEPRGGARIDLSSVKLTYLKTPNVELLDRVKQGLTENGIEFPAAEVPTGQHQIRITVQDSEGRQTSNVLTLDVIR